MKFLALPFLGLALLGCAREVSFRGVVVDEKNHFPVAGVRASALVQTTGGQFKDLTATTYAEGRFEFRFSSYQEQQQLLVGLRKEGYRENVYICKAQTGFDTLVLRRDH